MSMSRGHPDPIASSLWFSQSQQIFGCDSLLEELMAYGFNRFLTTHTAACRGRMT
jgi:hypothetical protein